MKVNSAKKEFQEIELNIIIETQEEAQALYAIFNHGNNAELLGNQVTEKIRESISGEYCVSKGIIAHDIKAEDFYKIPKSK